MTSEKQSISLTIDPELVARVDAYAKRLKVSRSAATSMLLSLALETMEDFSLTSSNDQE